MADTGALKAPARKGVRVRAPLPLLRPRKQSQVAVKKSKHLDRREIFRRTEHLNGDPKNYEVYVSKKTSPELNRKIKSGEVTITLQDLIDAEGDIAKLSG